MLPAALDYRQPNLSFDSVDFTADIGYPTENLTFEHMNSQRLGQENLKIIENVCKNLESLARTLQAKYLQHKESQGATKSQIKDKDSEIEQLKVKLEVL